jgi:hypothetical protein
VIQENGLLQDNNAKRAQITNTLQIATQIVWIAHQKQNGRGHRTTPALPVVLGAFPREEVLHVKVAQ